MEVDKYFEETPSQTPTNSIRPLSRSRTASPVPSPDIPPRETGDSEPFIPFAVPTLSSTVQPLPTFKSTSSFSQSFPSPSQESALAAAQKKPQPKFTPSPLSFSVIPDKEEPMLSPQYTANFPKKQINSNLIFLSAKDCALKLDQAALPFFTFAQSVPTVSVSETVRSEALKRAITTFTFTLPVFSGTSPSRASEWVCTTCMLRNPATAIKQCTICEAARPNGDVPLIASGDLGPHKNAERLKGDEEWTCSLCMLKNPGSAKEKCTICEAPRP